MPTLPAELLNLIVVFQPLFTKPTWEHAKALLIGALLAHGKRTVTACLRVVGLSQEEHFQNYHRVLNRAKWNPLTAAKILLGLIVLLLPPDSAIVVAADDTLERRRGRKIHGLGYWRDPTASSRTRTVNCYGLKWLSLMVLVAVPWSSRVWALPFLSVLCRAHKKGQRAKRWHTRRRKSGKKGKLPVPSRTRKSKDAPVALANNVPRQYKTVVDLLMILIRLVHRWQQRRLVVLVADGGYAAVKLALRCSGRPNLAMVTRLRWDAALYHPPSAQPEGKPGPKPLKGRRQRKLTAWAARSDTPWEEVEVRWYGGVKKKMEVFSRTALWHTEAEVPVPIRYVIARDPEGKLPDQVYACTKLDAIPEQIIEWYVQRWSVEVTFEEARAQLGLETQRQWSDLAITRTTPCLLGLFSLVVLLTLRLQPDGQIPRLTAAWYGKEEATFSDCLFLARKHLWSSFNYTGSLPRADSIYFPAQVWEHLLSCLAAVA
jgi:DDE superfamily endonuclease